jgi:hypothetical protein
VRFSHHRWIGSRELPSPALPPMAAPTTPGDRRSARAVRLTV